MSGLEMFSAADLLEPILLTVPILAACAALVILLEVIVILAWEVGSRLAAKLHHPTSMHTL